MPKRSAELKNTSPGRCRLQWSVLPLKVVTQLAFISSLACLPMQAQQAPTNDMFDARIPLGQVIESQRSTNTMATAETGEKPHRGTNPVRSLWWRWTAPQNGYVLVATTNSPSRTRVDVYDFHKVLS